MQLPGKGGLGEDLARLCNPRLDWRLFRGGGLEKPKKAQNHGCGRGPKRAGYVVATRMLSEKDQGRKRHPPSYRGTERRGIRTWRTEVRGEKRCPRPGKESGKGPKQGI